MSVGGGVPSACERPLLSNVAAMAFVLSAGEEMVVSFTQPNVVGASETSAGGVPCGALFTRVAAPAPTAVNVNAPNAPAECGASVDAGPAGTTPFFFAQHVSTRGFLVPAWPPASGGANAPQYFDLVLSAPASAPPPGALVFATKTYDPFAQGLPPGVLVAFLAPDDASMKGFCASGSPPWREFECPTPCGADTERAPTGCPLSWLSCNMASGYCLDTALLPPGAVAGSALVAPEALCGAAPSPLGPTYFPNCASRAMLAVLEASEAACVATAPATPPPLPTPSSLASLGELCAVVVVALAALAVLARLYMWWFPALPVPSTLDAWWVRDSSGVV